MNCKQIAKLMPELASGELDPQEEARAREHIRSCTRCAGELAHYEEVLGAMSQPWEMIEVPNDLLLVLPEEVKQPVRLTRLVPALGLAVLVVLTFVILPRLNRSADDVNKPVAVVTTEKRPIVKKTVPAEHKLAANTDVPDLVKTPKRVERGTLIRHRKYSHVAKHDTPKAVVTPVAAAPNDTSAAPAVEPSPTVIVIASTMPEPKLPEIYIESVDGATGEVTIQSITTDENGSIRESEVSFKAAGKNDWRNNL